MRQHNGTSTSLSSVFFFYSPDGFLEQHSTSQWECCEGPWAARAHLTPRPRPKPKIPFRFSFVRSFFSFVFNSKEIKMLLFYEPNLYLLSFVGMSLLSIYTFISILSWFPKCVLHYVRMTVRPHTISARVNVKERIDERAQASQRAHTVHKSIDYHPYVCVCVCGAELLSPCVAHFRIMNANLLRSTLLLLAIFWCVAATTSNFEDACAASNGCLGPTEKCARHPYSRVTVKCRNR